MSPPLAEYFDNDLFPLGQFPTSDYSSSRSADQVVVSPSSRKSLLRNTSGTVGAGTFHRSAPGRSKSALASLQPIRETRLASTILVSPVHRNKQDVFGETVTGVDVWEEHDSFRAISGNFSSSPRKTPLRRHRSGDDGMLMFSPSSSSDALATPDHHATMDDRGMRDMMNRTGPFLLDLS
jgi:hypothetical protein